MSTPRRRIIIQKPGSYRRLHLDNTPIEAPNPAEIQVEVMACGINFADIAVRLGLYAAAKGAYPLCPGLEFSGVVRHVGGQVRDFMPGDKIFGVSRFGGYSTVINCSPEHLWPLPETWDFTKAASFPVAYLTAYYALHHVGHLNKSHQVLVHSAAGGVGTALLHLLKANGNISVGVVGGIGKVTSAKKAGAAFVIDKGSEDLWKQVEALSPHGYDLILDANGASTLRQSYQHLNPTGRLLIYGFASMFSHSGRRNYLKLIWDYVRTPRFSPFDLTGSNKTVSGFNLIHLFEHVDLFRRIMDRLLELDRYGHIPQMPITPYPFEAVAEAHQALESGKSIGKLVLVVNKRRGNRRFVKGENVGSTEVGCIDPDGSKKIVVIGLSEPEGPGFKRVVKEDA